ncbi:MAG: hypothetical protein WCE53_05660 [Candidatus Acidiferrum sp.]
MIEVIADENPDAGFRLLLWNGAEAHIGSRIQLDSAPESQFGERTLYPPDVDATIRRAIRFPVHATPYKSSRELVTNVCNLIKRFVDMPEDLVSLAAFSVFASWFVDCTATPVCLSLVSPRPGQGSQLIRLLSCLYRRALLLGQTTLGGICALPLELQPALLIENGQCDGQLLKLLRLLNVQDAYVPWKGRLINLSCAKVISTEESLPVDLSAAGFIEIRVPPARRSLPILDHRAQQEIAKEFQPQLLTYRLVNYHSARVSEFDAPDLASPFRNFARCLGASVPDEPELQREIAPLLQGQSDQILVKCETDLDSVVIEAMFALCHEKDRQSFHVADVSNNANKILEQRGESLEMNPWTVGRRLNSLGITTKRLDSAGRGALLLNAMRDLVHKLAWERKVETVFKRAEECSDCKYFLNVEMEEQGLDVVD